MKIHYDLLGMALVDFISGKQNAKVTIHSPYFEDDEIPVNWYFRDFDIMPPVEQRALELSYGAILDAGAGAGSHAMYLTKKGLQVTALDISAGACEVMQKRGLPSVIQGDILNFTQQKWDTILMMMNGIGVFGNIDTLGSFLEKLPGMLNPGGQVLFDSTNLIYLFENDNGEIEINLNREYYGQISFQMEYEGFITPEFQWLYIDFDTLSFMAESHGLKVELLLNGDNYQYLARIIR